MAKLLLPRLEGLTRSVAVAGFRACAEAVIPANDLGAPDVAGTKLERRFDRWLDELPPEARILMELLYGAMELMAPLAVPAVGRLSSLSVERRTQLIEGWRKSSLMPLRFLVKAVKSPVVMMYLSDPDALRWIGAPKATWGGVGDARGDAR